MNFLEGLRLNGDNLVANKLPVRKDGVAQKSAFSSDSALQRFWNFARHLQTQF